MRSANRDVEGFTQIARRHMPPIKTVNSRAESWLDVLQEHSWLAPAATNSRILTRLTGNDPTCHSSRENFVMVVIVRLSTHTLVWLVPAVRRVHDGCGKPRTHEDGVMLKS